MDLIPDYPKLYCYALERTLIEQQQQPEDMELYKRVIFYGIKYFGVAHRDKRVKDQDIYTNLVQLLMCMKRLTPADLMELFPPNKVYQGELNYFATMKMINAYGLHRPIAGNALEMFLHYGNEDIQCLIGTWRGLQN